MVAINHNVQYADIVLVLNQYYLRLGLITRKHQDIERLHRQAMALNTEIDKLLLAGPTFRTVSTYGGERVQLSHDADSLGRLHCQWEDRLMELRERRFEVLDEVRLIEQQIWELQSENMDIDIALAGLTLLQRQVIEQRHKHRRTSETIGQILHYSQPQISRIYKKALDNMRDIIYPAICIKYNQDVCYDNII